VRKEVFHIYMMMLYTYLAVLAVSLQSYGVAYGADNGVEWYTLGVKAADQIRTLSPQALELRLASDGNTSCVFNQIAVHWTIIDESLFTSPLDYLIAVENVGTHDVNVKPLLSPNWFARSKAESSTVHNGPIRCVINEDHCTPKVTDIIALTSDPSNLRLVIKFDVNTTAPRLSSVTEITNALSIFPPVIGQISGEWREANILELSICGAFFDQIMTVYRSGGRTVIAARQVDFLRQSHISSDAFITQIRTSKPSELMVRVISIHDMSVVSNVLSISTVLCEQAGLLPDGTKIQTLSVINETVMDHLLMTPVLRAEMQRQTPEINMEGIFPISGQKALVFPHSLALLVNPLVTSLVLIHDGSCYRHQGRGL
jgi:hypothetical protein